MAYIGSGYRRRADNRLVKQAAEWWKTCSLLKERYAVEVEILKKAFATDTKATFDEANRPPSRVIVTKAQSIKCEGRYHLFDTCSTLTNHASTEAYSVYICRHCEKDNNDGTFFATNEVKVTAPPSSKRKAILKSRHEVEMGSLRGNHAPPDNDGLGSSSKGACYFNVNQRNFNRDCESRHQMTSLEMLDAFNDGVPWPGRGQGSDEYRQMRNDPNRAENYPDPTFDYEDPCGSEDTVYDAYAGYNESDSRDIYKDFGPDFFKM